MKKMKRDALYALVLSTLCLAYAGASWAGTEKDLLLPPPAVSSVIANTAQIVGSDWAGDRIVAVGDHGIVLISDDQGASYRQASKVPLSSQLNAVSFVNAKQGWAVGHLGAILATQDGGDTWQIQRVDTVNDRPLYSVHFFDEHHGVAVGLWSLVLTTADGGKTWAEQKIAPPPNAKKADLNLLSLFAADDQNIYATAERGQLLSSKDRGLTWSYTDTGYKGTLWSGAKLSNGDLLVGGQRGNFMRGRPGSSWTTVSLKTTGSITDIAASDAHVAVVGLDGTVAVSHDHGKTFAISLLPDGASLTSVVLTKSGEPLLFSRRGPVVTKR
jgi:photosystem II stability/assembly factor-like uncharacterized protein